MKEPIITVDAQKLSRGLRMTFEGIAVIFDSLGAGESIKEILPEELPMSSPPEKVESPTQEESSQKVADEKLVKEMTKPQSAPEPPSEPKSSESAASSLTLDDITTVIVNKMKQNQANRGIIEKMVQGFGVAAISQIPTEKYETFMTQLAAL